MSYTYNKAPKDRELLKAIRGVIVKDIRQNGLTMKDFAHEIGLSEGTLENKLKPAMATSDITISEFIHIMDITGNYYPLELIAKRYGFILSKPSVKKEEIDDLTVAVTIKTLGLEELHGLLAKTVKEAVKDGVLNNNEKEQIKDIAYQFRKLAAELEESMK